MTVWSHRHTVLTWTLWLHLPVVAVLVRRHDHVDVVLVAELALLVGAALCGAFPRLDRRVRTLAVTVGLVSCSGLLVHLTGGLTESHFHFFVVIALLSLYQEWMPFLVGFGFTVVHHGVTGVLDPRAVYGHQAAWDRPVLWAFVHGGYIALAAAANLVAWRLAELEHERTVNILDAAGEAIYGRHPDGRIVFANPAMAELLGTSVGALVGRQDHAVLRHRAEEDGTCPVCRHVAAAEGAASTEWTLGDGGGRRFPAEITSRPFELGDRREGSVVTFRDIGERLEMEEDLRLLALTDTMTGLANRKRFLDEVDERLAGEHAGAPAHGTALLFCDLDGFKAVNDRFGHAAGDAVLTAVARRLTASVRDDDMVARLGGDEFAICMSVGGPEEAERLAARIVDALERPIGIPEGQADIGVSVGVVCCGDVPDPEELVRRGDAAMYEAKRRGGSRVVTFDEQMLETATGTRAVERALEEALRRDELVLYYQPVVGSSGREVDAIEALLRWRHPTRGLLPPSEFIEIAERSRVIFDLGRWVLERACRDTAALNVRRARPLSVSVNVSPRQLVPDTLREHVVQALEASSLAPGLLTIEITERVVIEDAGRAADVLGELRALGVRVALDDFGTGYSAFSYLRDLPVDEMKIDRGFIGRLLDGSEGEALVATMMRLAQAFGLQTVAEGVEEGAQMPLLAAMGCERVQGFLFSPPVALEDLDGILVALAGDVANDGAPAPG